VNRKLGRQPFGIGICHPPTTEWPIGEVPLSAPFRDSHLIGLLAIGPAKPAPSVPVARPASHVRRPRNRFCAWAARAPPLTLRRAVRTVGCEGWARAGADVARRGQRKAAGARRVTFPPGPRQCRHRGNPM